MILLQLLAGMLSDFLPYRSVALLFSTVCIVSILLLILPHRREIEPLFTQAKDAPTPS